ncbi:MAG: hypothetical protein KDJ64_09845 [Nitratireductor sp.]|nr:hypothetical protein [Nitratireductor sp.]
MRFLSVLLILAGLAIAFALPLYQTDFAGEAVETVEVFDRTKGGWRDGWQDGEIGLTASGGPYRIRLEGELISGSVNLPATLPVFVELTGPQGPVFSGEFKLGVREENPNSGTVSERLFVSLPEFDVLADGAHTLSVRLLTEGDINLARMQAEIVGKAQAADYSFTSAGLGIFAVGTLLYLISGRRRKKARTENSRRWGRQ